MYDHLCPLCGRDYPCDRPAGRCPHPAHEPEDLLACLACLDALEYGHPAGASHATGKIVPTIHPVREEE